MQLSAKAHFKDAAANNKKILIRAQTAIPQEWLKSYLKAARGGAPGVVSTPKKTGALRRSIITQAIGGRAEVSWRLPYAVPQNLGGHTVPRMVQGLNPATGMHSTIKPGFYRYRNYTTPGTGPGFAQAAYRYANSQLPQITRQTGLTK